MNPKEVEQIYQHYSDMVFRVALIYMKNQDDAYDIVHNVFEKIFALYGRA